MLYIVATPIGNLDDITLRALTILKTADVIACEDTRHTLKLLQHFGITNKKLVSYHNFNERGSTDRLLAHLENGESVALVSDAGTPSISDPGFYLVRAAHQKGIRVVPIGGISAITAAISVCPIPIRYFYFEGFLPQKKGRQTRLKFLATLESTIIFYESPHRLLKLLDELLIHIGNRQLMIGRELTKLHEELFVGTALEAKQEFSEKKILGEFVIIVDSKNSATENNSDEAFDDDDETH
jgi:16S rRNA (cytidine1402-2'-O)-methyltransferase